MFLGFIKIKYEVVLSFHSKLEFLGLEISICLFFVWLKFTELRSSHFMNISALKPYVGEVEHMLCMQIVSGVVHGRISGNRPETLESC